MCGIIGFCGYLDAKEELIKGLAELEYRGYDSAGIACYTDRGIEVIKSVGKVEGLKNKLPAKLESSCGIGHTRWATHGGVSEVNAHPHRSGNVTLIHNGIIENYHELAKELEGMGKIPVSQTDTEIAAMLLDSLYESNQGNVLETLRGAVERLEGAYAFCIMFADQKDVIYCIRKGSPLVCCSSEEGSIVASDMVALLRYSKEYFVLPEFQVAKVTKNTITVMDLDGTVVSPVMLSVHWDMSAAQKNGFKHYMLKEIHEQPEAIRRTLAPRMKKGNYLLPDFTEDGITDEVFKNTNRVVITACGTAMHAGMAGKILMEKLLRIPVQVEIASEFRYADPILDENTLVILVSQSGETADTLAALRLAREKGAKTLSIVNVKGSSIARESDYVLYTHAGPEIAVASTKAYTAQLTAFYLLAFRFAYVIGKRNEQEISYYMKGLDEVGALMEKVLEQKDKMKELSKRLTPAQDLFFIGRSLDYALACEGSIKLKEITYIHSEAYAAGELKHGTLSLVTGGVPVIALATQSDVFAKMISNVKEVRARGAMVILITKEDNDAVIENTIFDERLMIPAGDDIFAPFTAAIILQLLAYYTSSYRGLDVDQPRNLAKSVTVE
ncbi:MAG: glutamine--fructose-6-phosphate transaminase (isomerizing) [Lachnospiraceae bacterium]|nr:glutamine--fructose-6-phosphate transaminase (isomerizing) [Lachnospiraceae bacterium]MBQ6994484.1 glutamine--fructose-6-phosphate transaminase (isomerizing) [Lachnospiraceae bacterium]